MQSHAPRTPHINTATHTRTALRKRYRQVHHFIDALMDHGLNRFIHVEQASRNGMHDPVERFGLCRPVRIARHTAETPAATVIGTIHNEGPVSFLHHDTRVTYTPAEWRTLFYKSLHDYIVHSCQSMERTQYQVMMTAFKDLFPDHTLHCNTLRSAIEKGTEDELNKVDIVLAHLEERLQELVSVIFSVNHLDKLTQHEQQFHTHRRRNTEPTDVRITPMMLSIADEVLQKTKMHLLPLLLDQARLSQQNKEEIVHERDTYRRILAENETLYMQALQKHNEILAQLRRDEEAKAAIEHAHPASEVSTDNPVLASDTVTTAEDVPTTVPEETVTDTMDRRTQSNQSTDSQGLTPSEADSSEGDPQPKPQPAPAVSRNNLFKERRAGRKSELRAKAEKRQEEAEAVAAFESLQQQREIEKRQAEAARIACAEREKAELERITPELDAIAKAEAMLQNDRLTHLKVIDADWPSLVRKIEYINSQFVLTDPSQPLRNCTFKPLADYHLCTLDHPKVMRAYHALQHSHIMACEEIQRCIQRKLKTAASSGFPEPFKVFDKQCYEQTYKSINKKTHYRLVLEGIRSGFRYVCALPKECVDKNPDQFFTIFGDGLHSDLKLFPGVDYFFAATDCEKISRLPRYIQFNQALDMRKKAVLANYARERDRQFCKLVNERYSPLLQHTKTPSIPQPSHRIERASSDEQSLILRENIIYLHLEYQKNPGQFIEMTQQILCKKHVTIREMSRLSALLMEYTTATDTSILARHLDLLPMLHVRVAEHIGAPVLLENDDAPKPTAPR